MHARSSQAPPLPNLVADLVSTALTWPAGDLVGVLLQQHPQPLPQHGPLARWQDGGVDVLQQRLQSWTGNRWAVTVVNGGGAATIAETRDSAAMALRDRASALPLVAGHFVA